MDRLQAARELAVAPGATAEVVERAFRRAARRHHPDVGGDAPAFRRAAEARAVLLGPPPAHPVGRVVDLVVRHHPAVRLLDAVLRALDRRAGGR